MPITIDESLFAHINNDPFLIGSVGLQGNTFKTTIGYLTQYLNELTYVPIEVQRLLSACQMLVQLEVDITLISTKDQIKRLSETIYQRITNLNEDDYILVPGGWRSPSGGHAIIYQFEKDSKGNILFHINNSGSGLSYHKKQSSASKELYNPVLTYLIPKSHVNKQNYFTAIINQLLEIQRPAIHKRTEITPENLYLDIFQQLIHLNGTVVELDNKNHEHWLTGGQLSGTCSQRSLHQMLKSRFPNLDAYRHFIYGFKLKSLKDYLSTFATPFQLKDRHRLSQVEKAIRHNLRLLNNPSQENPEHFIFSEEQRAKDLLFFSTKLSEINALYKLTIPTTTTFTEGIVSSEASYFHINLPTTIKPLPSTLNSLVPEELLLSPIEILVNNLDVQLDNVLKHCKKIHNKPELIMEQVERFLFALPVDTDAHTHKVYSVFTGEQRALVFLNGLNTLQTLYFQACSKIIGADYTLPNIFLSKMIFIRVTGIINELNPLHSNIESCFDRQFVANQIMKILPELSNSVYLANYEPSLDLKTQAIQKYYQNLPKHYVSSDSLLYYYDKILEEFPSLRAALEKKYIDLYAYKNDELHRELRKNQLGALFYFFTHKEALATDLSFQPLLNKFNIQALIEKNILDYSEDFKTSYAISFGPIIRLNNSFLSSKGTYVEKKSSLRIPAELKKASFPVNNIAFERVFDIDGYTEWGSTVTKRNDNHTQLYPHKYASQTLSMPYDAKKIASLADQPIDPLELEQRELFHLRRHSPTQILLSIDYFLNHMHHLNDESYQLYLEANIFQPGLLCDQLKKSSLFFARFDELINEGLKYFDRRGLLTQHSLYLLKLNYLVTQYAYNGDPTNKYFIERLALVREELNRYSIINKSMGVKAGLHELRLLLLTNRLKQQTMNSEDKNDLLLSQFFVMSKVNTNTHTSLFYQSKVKEALLSSKRFFQTNSIDKTFLVKILSELGIAIELSWSIEEQMHPIYRVSDEQQIHHYSIDVARGTLFDKEGRAYVALPLAIRSHPMIEQLGFEEVTNGFLATDKRTYYLEKASAKVRLIEGEKHQFFIQKMFPDSSGQERYFQLVPQTKAHGELYQVAFHIEPRSFSKLLQQREVLLWKALDKEEVLFTSFNKIFLRGSNKNYAYNLFRDLKTELIPSTSFIESTVNEFENKSFIASYLISDKKQYLIELERYNLTLTGEVTTKKISINWQGEDYLLNKKISFAKGIPSLEFEKSNGKNLCFLPVQRFISTKERRKDNEYYQLRLDTNNEVPADIMKKDKQHFWQHSATQKYFVYTRKEGKPIPTTPAEALYLVYLYLGSNQPEKAWETLDYCDSKLGGLEGTFDELRFMQWMFNALPYVIEGEPDATIQNPQFAACKLKALSLVTRFKQSGKSFEYPPPVESLKSINERLQQVEIQAVSSFEEQINKIVYSTYSNYQRMYRDNANTFLLNQDEQKSLLEFYHDSLPETESEHPKAIGALGAEWVSLKFKSLIKESASLKAKQSLTVYEKQRLEEINLFIETHLGVANKTSELVEVSIDTRIPLGIGFNHQLLKPESALSRFNGYGNHFYQLFSPNYYLAMSALLPGVSDETFLEHFSYYLSIAITPEERPELRNQLKHFCYSNLLSSRHIPLAKAQSNIPLLCNVLYRFLNEERAKPYTIPSEDYNRTFSNLITQACKLPDPKITIFQLKDKTKRILLSSKELYKQLEKQHTLPHPIDYELLHYQSIGLFATQEFLENASRWRTIEQNSSTEDQSQDQEVKFFSSKELRLGAQRYKILSNKKSEALRHFTDENLIALELKVSEDSLLYAEKINDLERELLFLANLGPDDQKKKQQWAILIEANQKSRLDINSLLQLFFQNDVEKYRLESGLGEKKIKDLHQLLAHYIYTKNQWLQLGRVKKQIHVINHSAQDKAQELLALGDLLYAENLIDPLMDPDLAVYQLHANLLIRPIQKEAISDLLSFKENKGFSEHIVRIIMGGGKSKVLLPTLAYKKATGTNIALIEVPQSLLRTNYVDLKSTSKELFGQEAVLFEFNRQSECTSKRLEQMFHQLTDVMINKKYLVTTNDSIQSIELKFFELLNSPPEDKNQLKEWEQQVEWSRKILRLFRERGDVIIDEVHQGLLLKNKQNYTVGEDRPINQVTVENCVELYKFLRLVPAKFLPEHSLMDLLKNNKLLDNPSADEAFIQLAEELVNNPESPLSESIQKASFNDKETLKKYLLGTSLEVPKFILGLDVPTKDQIALYKEQVSHLLPHTLRRNHFEHYGPSKKTSSAPALRALAIPYVANNKPSERSRFGNFIETVDYTIQSLLLSGVSIELFKNYIDMLQTQARQELSTVELNIKQIKDTPSAKQFRILFKEDAYALENISLDDDELISKMHQLIAGNDEFTFEILEKQILGQIRLEAGILHSDAYNHVDILRSCQGMSGTPWNYQTFHQRLHFDNTSSEGLDAFVYQSFMDKKNTIVGYDFQNTFHAITYLFNQYDDATPLRAIIDINALFKGVSNKEIADEVAQYLIAPEHAKKFRTTHPIKFILYFNEENKICALPLQGYPNNAPIVLGSSDVDVINERLGCSPEERFTIYDQDHTVGTDIKQGKNAKALVMVDNHTSLSHFFQGIMRMRALIEGEQSVDLVVPTALQSKSKRQLCELMHQEESNNLKEDNFAAACAQLANVVRAAATQHILSLSGEKAAQRRHELFKLFKKFFIEEQESNLFKLYGGITKKALTATILADLKKNYLQDYKQIVEQVLEDSAKDVAEVEEAMDKIINKACLPGMCAMEQVSCSTVLDNEVEVQKEVQVEVQTQKETQNQMYDPRLEQANYVSWSLASDLKIKTLAEVCESSVAVGFTDNIKTTCNFYQTYRNQNQYLNKYMKPVHALLFQKINGKLECTLLAQLESEELDKIGYFVNKECWLSTTNHTPLLGSMPPEIVHDKEYQRIIEQVRFFNGEFTSLLSGDIELHWIKEKSKEKMDFFEQYLYHHREVLPRELEELKTHLESRIDAVYRYIFSDLNLNGEKVDWQGQFQTLNKAQVKEAKKLTQVANKLANEWELLDLHSSDWYKEYSLSLRAQVFLLEVVETLAHIKEVVNEFDKETYSLEVNSKINALCQISPEFKRQWQASKTVSEKGKSLQYLIIERGLKPTDIINVVRASDPTLEFDEFNELVSLAHTNPSILFSLIENPTPLNTPDVLSSYITFKQSKKSLEALVKHPHFSIDEQTNLLTSAKLSEVGDECVVLLLKQKELSLSFSTVLNNEKDPIVLKSIAEKIDNELVMKRFLEVSPDSLQLVPVSALVKPSFSDELIKTIIGHDLARYKELIHSNEVLNNEILRNKLIKCSSSKQKLEYVISHFSSAKKIGATEVHSILDNAFINHINKETFSAMGASLTQEGISVCVEKMATRFDDELFLSILNNRHLIPEQLTELIKKSNSTALIKEAVRNMNFKKDHLLVLIEQPETKLATLDSVFWINALKKSKDEALLAQFIAKALKTPALISTLSHPSFLTIFPEAAHILALAKETPSDVLHLLVHTENDALLLHLIKHKNISEESLHEILLKQLPNTLLPELIKVCAQKSDDLFTLIADKAEVEYNRTFFDDLLENASSTFTLQYLLHKSQHMDEKDGIKFLEHPYGTDQLAPRDFVLLARIMNSESAIDIILPKIEHDNDDAYIELLRKPACTPKQLKYIIERTRSSKVLQEINPYRANVDEDCFKALLAHADEVLSDMGDIFWRQYINNCPTIELLKEISGRAFFSRAIQTLLDTRLENALMASLNNSVLSLRQNNVLNSEQANELLQFWHKVILTQEVCRFLVHNQNVSLEALKQVAQKTTDDDLLNSIISHVRWHDDLAQDIIQNKSVRLDTLKRLYKLNPKLTPGDKIFKLVDNNKLSPLDVIKNFESIFELNVMRVLLNKIESSIKLALNKTITSNRFILFSRGSKADKDQEISRNLYSLNLSLAKDADKDTVLQNFTQLCSTACKRRNKLIVNEYSHKTHSARYLTREFLMNTKLLEYLGIPASLDEKKKKEQLQEKMLEVCHQKKGVVQKPG